MRAAAAALTMLAFAGTAGAQAYDGAWSSLDASACRPGSDAVLRVEGNRLRYYESQCTLSNPVPVNRMAATLYDADCAGEGETWQHRMMLMRTEDGHLLHVAGGHAMLMTACPAGSMDAPAGK